jgi:hypothetical protein
MDRLDVDFVLVDLKRPYLVVEDSAGNRIADVYYDQLNFFEWDGVRYLVETPFTTPDQEFRIHRLGANMVPAILSKTSAWLRRKKERP